MIATYTCSVLTNHPVPAGIKSFYFEITQSSDEVGEDAGSVIGFATHSARLRDVPGFEASSWGYHSDDGSAMTKYKRNDQFTGQSYGKGDTVGCGVMYDDESVEGRIFMTKEGKSLGWAFETGVIGRLYPAAGLWGNLACTANFGEDLDTKPFLWAPANKRSFRADDVQAVAEEDAAKEPEKL